MAPLRRDAGRLVLVEPSPIGYRGAGGELGHRGAGADLGHRHRRADDLPDGHRRAVPCDAGAGDRYGTAALRLVSVTIYQAGRVPFPDQVFTDSAVSGVD